MNKAEHLPTHLALALISMGRCQRSHQRMAVPPPAESRPHLLPYTSLSVAGERGSTRPCGPVPRRQPGGRGTRACRPRRSGLQPRAIFSVERAKNPNQGNLISEATTSSLKMQSDARKTRKLNDSSASVSAVGLTPYLKQSFDTQEIVGWMEEDGEAPRARWGSPCRCDRAVSATRPGMFVNKDTEPRRHRVFLFQPTVYLRRNVIGIILHFQVR